MAAGEFWQSEKITELSWMFSGDKEVDEETQRLVTFRSDSEKVLQLLKGVIACENGVTCKMAAKLRWILVKMKGAIKDIEDREGLGVIFKGGGKTSKGHDNIRQRLTIESKNIT